MILYLTEKETDGQAWSWSCSSRLTDVSFGFASVADAWQACIASLEAPNQRPAIPLVAFAMRTKIHLPTREGDL
jgi:hypothetical protein